MSLDKKEHPERIVCPRCLFSNDPDVPFCKECGAPIGMVSTIDPIQRIHSEGFCYRSAVDGPPSLIVLIGIWLIFLPVVVGVPILTFGDWNGAPGIFLLPMGIFGAVIIFRTTKNYFQKSKSSRQPSMFVAAYLILHRKDEVLLLRRFNTGYRDGDYSLVSGHVENEEQVTVSLGREAHEEAGITIDPAKLDFIHLVQRKCDDGRVYLDFFFATDRWQGEVTNMEPRKCDELKWYSIHALPSNILPHVREVLSTYWKSSVKYSESGWEDSKTI